MPLSKRTTEGYYMVDHRAGDPMPGLPRGLYEAPTYTCSHCNTVVIINPQRTRSREWCSGCDHYVCDECGLKRKNDGICRTYKQFIDEIQHKEFLNG